MSTDQVQQYLDRCETLIPQEDEAERGLEPPQTEEVRSIDDILTAARHRAEEAVSTMEAQAEDAATAVAYAFECRQNGEARSAAWAGRVSYSSLDEYVINKEGIDPNSSGAEQRILSHPLIQAELARQRRDLDELRAVRNESDIAGVVALLRDRAKAEASTVFG